MTASPRYVINAALLIFLAVLPFLTDWAGDSFYTGLVSRILILAIAALSLNLLIGYGGMVSFGHAAYIGVGAYVVGIGAFHAFEDGIDWMLNGYAQLAAALFGSAVIALIIGAISLRTRGVYFIMITMAFSQMLYFSAVGVETYGADDGLTIYSRSDMLGLIDLNNEKSLYYLIFLSLLVVLYLMHRLVGSPFGNVIRGTRSNEARMRAIGFSPYKYRLTAFVIAGVIAGYAGFLMANLNDFVSPDLMHWTRSGDLIIMIVLGGMSSLFGPLYGALAFLILEELLSSIPLTVGGLRIGEYWQLIFGPLLILIVLYARNGIDSFLPAARKEE
ncbi:branched-chain amino acid ABC transporter permease [Sneathiella chungangensis]|uniref:Branched-chain amino acid ABC transporter permease n=1 Tax=Sneathiella chungangensis TaxID=1418234 RepID=A0A845MB45_9PROT|nr:branched-chain amino acid ABC transporter permease [Sneathiella chungangensis]MZR21042.1 branched-chain amino acid ABC transporter permease [Sneathiella chungangensis]